MLRAAASLLKPRTCRGILARFESSKSTEMTLTERDKLIINFCNQPDITYSDIHMACRHLSEFTEIPEPEIVTSLMKAARRLNDYAMTVRILEMVKFKCTYNPIAFCYIMQEIEPVLTELGINSLEELGYDKPELYMEDTHFH